MCLVESEAEDIMQRRNGDSLPIMIVLYDTQLSDYSNKDTTATEMDK